MISSVPASKGMQFAEEVTTVALALACAAVVPTPRNTVTCPAFKRRYWLPPIVVETACTVEGATLAAVNVTVLPVGVKGALTAIIRSKVQVW